MAHVLNNPPATWICQCGREEHNQGALPAGWEWRGSVLLCDDCLRIAAFSHGQDRADLRPAATPVRHAGKPDDTTSILLRSGAYLDLADPDCTRIAAVDIAAGLRQFRFAAQTREAYTIAQHSLLVLQLVERVECGSATKNKLRWCALLHDAAEAFLHDITRPLKCQLPDYKRIEQMFEARFANAFDIPWTANRHQLVKRADLQALAIEKRDLCPRPADDRPWLHLAGIPASEQFRISRVWSPAEAEERFLETFHKLRPIPAAQQEIAA